MSISTSSSITAAIVDANAAYGRYQYRTPLSSLPHRVFRLNSPPDYLIPHSCLSPLLDAARSLSLLLHREGIDVPELAALDKALEPLASVDK